MVKIYTKAGDLGTTSLLGKSGELKNSSRIVAYGELDELNANLAEILLYVLAKDQELLTKIINEIFNISSHIACVGAEFEKMLSSLNIELVNEIESRIDEIDSILPQLKAFVLPIGPKELVRIHQVRTIARRSERSLINLRDEIDPYILKFVNRLSDYLFILARKYGYDHNVEEVEWKKN